MRATGVYLARIPKITQQFAIMTHRHLFISFIIAQRLPLMRLAQKVYNGLDRIKGNKRHLYELGIPVAHCAVP